MKALYKSYKEFEKKNFPNSVKSRDYMTVVKDPKHFAEMVAMQAIEQAEDSFKTLQKK